MCDSCDGPCPGLPVWIWPLAPVWRSHYVIGCRIADFTQENAMVSGAPRMRCVPGHAIDSCRVPMLSLTVTCTLAG